MLIYVVYATYTQILKSMFSVLGEYTEYIIWNEMKWNVIKEILVPFDGPAKEGIQVF